MGACLGVESRRPTLSPQTDLHGSAAVSSSVDSAGGSSNKTRSFTAELSSGGSTTTASTEIWSKWNVQVSIRSRIDPELQFFDSAHQQLSTSIRAISSSQTVLPVEFRSFSFNSLNEVITSCALLDMNHQDAVRIILEYCKKGIWKNGDLSRLVEEYVGNSPETLHNCTMTLDKFLNELQLMARRCFEEEDEAEKGDGKYARTTLEELRNLIKALGDLFGEELQSVYTQQLSVMEKLERRKQKVDKKLKSIKTWRKVSIITFASAFAAVLICSVVAAAMAAPTVAATLAAAASIPVGSIGKWVDSLWKKYEDALKGEKELINAMIAGTRIAIFELDSIRYHVVEQPEIIQIDAILAAADVALTDEEAVNIGIGEIKRKLGDFMNSIKDLGKLVDRCTRNVTKARTVVLQKIIKYPA